MSTLSAPQGRPEVEKLFALSEAKQRYLCGINPMLIDVSLLEPCFGAAIVHTLANKQALLPLVDEFGVKDKIIATLNYQLPHYPQVEDDFCQYLLETKYDMTGCFALTGVGRMNGSQFTPHLSMEKLVAYRIPNTVHEISLLPKGDTKQVLASLCAC
ncbi:hypothetical protein, partial [Undibacterium sp. 10I3]